MNTLFNTKANANTNLNNQEDKVMMRMNVEQYMDQMNAGHKEVYNKEEVFPELKEIQKEIVNVVLGEASEESRIYEAKHFIIDRNEELGNVLSETEMQEFIDGCENLANMIRKSISYESGLRKAAWSIDKLQTRKVAVKGLELQTEDAKIKIDNLVITAQGISIVEVKNTSKEVFIDEYGDYYTMGEILRKDCNIGKKLEAKEAYIRNCLERAGYTNIPIQKIIVFTRNNIKVHNECKDLSVCFLSQLAYMLDRFTGEYILNMNQMFEIKNLFTEASIKEQSIEMDVQNFQKLIAEILVKFENAKYGIQPEKNPVKVRSIFSFWNKNKLVDKAS